MKTFGFRATLVFSLMLITSTASCSYLTKAEYAREEIVRESNRAISVLQKWLGLQPVEAWLLVVERLHHAMVNW